MAKKKTKQVLAETEETSSPAPSPTPIGKKTSSSSSSSTRAPPMDQQSSSLIICRNKHWRYISAFHGPWLQMPMEILETIANINYNAPRPRPVDPASLFDLVKVRRLVDEATNLAVRAASDIASPTLTNVHGGFGDSGSLTGSMHGAKLSRERKFRMREQASQKLARAYRLDEIACSVATMQGASSLEEVGNLVLQRSPKDSDARYVHFFHEKIPSRQLAESTSLQPLSDIIAEHPTEPEVLRTRAIVRVFKEDHEGAVQDLTHAISACRFHGQPQPQQQQPQGELQAQDPSHQNRRRPQDIILADKDQPSSLQGQLLFQRATVYLTMACRHVSGGIPPRTTDPEADPRDEEAGATPDDNTEETDPQTLAAKKQQLESCKTVKTLAKRALRDYMAFIAQFEYSPNLPLNHAREFHDRINLAVQGARNPRPPESTPSADPRTVYSLADLFAPVPPSDLPPYPSTELARNGSSTTTTITTHCELASYHPLLADALHSLLLCHCLAQTSPKELQRHACMVARLVRIIDGYPIFQPSRSPARSDWMEVLWRSDNWLNLPSDWETLCAPTPLPTRHSPSPDHQRSQPNAELAASAAAALINGDSPDAAAEELRRSRIRERAIVDALDDDRVTDEDSMRAAILAREKRAQDGRAAVARPSNGHYTRPGAPPKRWSGEDARDPTSLTDRAAAVSLWIRQAPVVTGTSKKKKKPKKTGKTADVEQGMEKLDIE